MLDGAYEKSGESDGNTMTKSDAEEAKKWGVNDPTAVGSAYNAGKGATQKSLQFNGVYGQIDDPEKVIDAMFAESKKNSTSSDGSEESIELVGEPKEFTPDGFDNGVMKCQEMKFKMTEAAGSSAGPGSFTMPMCIWGDHSTVVYVVSSDAAAILTGKSMTLDEAAAQAAKLRNEVRVEIK